MQKVLVFGVFDGLHSGHIHFLKQARKMADKLIVAVAPDEVVRKLKNKTPRLDQNERKELVASLKTVDQAIMGDREVSSYKILKRLKPDVICLGYDQKELAKDLKKHLPKMKIVILRAYKGHKLHASKLRNS